MKLFPICYISNDLRASGGILTLMEDVAHMKYGEKTYKGVLIDSKTIRWGPEDSDDIWVTSFNFLLP